MAITLPNLDDRRWADLVEEARSLIPVHAPGWTDHNVHDPGITLLDLFGWIAESDIYRLNRITPSLRRKFLRLIGIDVRPPLPARTVLGIELRPGAAPFALPAGSELETVVSGNRFRTDTEWPLIPGRLLAVQTGAEDLQDLTAKLERADVVPIFGSDPHPDTAVYFGLTDAPPVGTPLTLAFTMADLVEGAEEALALDEAARQRAAGCQPPAGHCGCDPRSGAGNGPDRSARRHHHSVRTRWEHLDATGAWRPVPGDRVIDETRGFTLNGRVTIRLDAPLQQSQAGRVPQKLYYLRCRLTGGRYDTPPMLRHVALNGSAVRQVAHAGVVSWRILANAVIEGPVPTAGDRAGFHVHLDQAGAITHLRFGVDAAPGIGILDFHPPTAGGEGVMTIDAARVGRGSGRPHQSYLLRDAPVVRDSVALLTLEDGAWRHWAARADFDASRRGDAHFVLDPQGGVVTFGDGRSGRVPPADALIVATFDTTRGDPGRFDRGQDFRFVDSPWNRALLARSSLGSAADVAGRLHAVRNVVAAVGGAGAESLEAAEVRAAAVVASGHQAVTAADYEARALAVPGTRVARAAARANLHPSFPGVLATGVIAVVIVPHLPPRRPMPSEGLRRAVAAHLATRRLLGTRVEIASPTYVEISVSATVHPHPHANAAELQVRLGAALDAFLDPLRGGPERTGWPFGRDVYRSEILQVLDDAPGVDYVSDLVIFHDGKQARCSNVCIGPLGLTTPGEHTIAIGGGGACQRSDRSR